MGNHKYKGETFLNLNKILLNNVRSWNLKDVKTSSNNGTLKLVRFEKEINYPFIDYLRGGMEINLIASIDYTASNEEPSNPISLHYMTGKPDAPLNQYQQAI
jgi:hypothetical protein